MLGVAGGFEVRWGFGAVAKIHIRRNWKLVQVEAGCRIAAIIWERFQDFREGWGRAAGAGARFEMFWHVGCVFFFSVDFRIPRSVLLHSAFIEMSGILDGWLHSGFSVLACRFRALFEVMTLSPLKIPPKNFQTIPAIRRIAPQFRNCIPKFWLDACIQLGKKCGWQPPGKSN